MEASEFPVSATVISFLPYDVAEPKPGLLPSVFLIPKATEKDDFTVTHITDCINHVPTLDGHSLSRMISGIEVAGSIARDHIMGTHGVSEDAYPGIKAISGKHDKESIKKNFPDLLEGLLAAQKRWFVNIVKLADDVWSDPNARGRQRSISDLQRFAAKYLGLNREYLTAVVANLVACFACGYMIPSSALICLNCKTEINPSGLKAYRDSLSVVALKAAQPVSQGTK